MRLTEPYMADDLAEFDAKLLSRADRVIRMVDVFNGDRDPKAIALRHDVDNHLRGVAELAKWEHDRGYRATYFILHDSPYWEDPALPEDLEYLALLGHEIGLHANGIAEAIRSSADPDEIIHAALDRLRGWGHDVIGVVAHGDQLCGKLGFVNDEQFTECARPDKGDPDRWINDVVKLRPRPLADFGLEYESYRLGRALYLSDSGGYWNEPFGIYAQKFPSPRGQLHILQHPCWWPLAFPMVVSA